MDTHQLAGQNLSQLFKGVMTLGIMTTYIMTLEEESLGYGQMSASRTKPEPTSQRRHDTWDNDNLYNDTQRREPGVWTNVS
jgi:hypothetical protein